MGENEKCPKCKGMLKYEKGGYESCNVSNGYGIQILPYVSCPVCGLFKELPYEPEYRREVKKIVVNYPPVRKPLGDPCWLQTLVRKHQDRIEELRYKKQYSWAQLFDIIASEVPQFAKTTKTALNRAFNKVTECK